MIRAICTLLFFVLIPLSGFAETKEEFYKDFYTKNFSGWKGIVFYCSFDADDKTLDKICQRAISDVELLAAAYKVELKTSKNNYLIVAQNKDHVILQYDLLATPTSSQHSAKAVHARLSFLSSYSNAIEKNAKSGTLDGMPRSGELDLWSRYAIGSNITPNDITAFSDYAEQHIKSAMTVYLKYTK